MYHNNEVRILDPAIETARIHWTEYSDIRIQNDLDLVIPVFLTFLFRYM